MIFFTDVRFLEIMELDRTENYSWKLNYLYFSTNTTYMFSLHPLVENAAYQTFCSVTGIQKIRQVIFNTFGIREVS